MATYAELYDLNSNSPLRNKIAVAATSAQISNATDATIQTAVTAAVDKLIAGGVA